MKCVVYCIFLFVSGVLFMACSTPIKIVVSNYEDSNLNNRGDNVPVTLLIYQLRDGKRFEYASPQDLLTRESVVLGRDKIDAIRIQIPPNEKNMVAAEIHKKEGKYIGILALFTNSQGKNQKFYKKLHSVFRNTIRIDITHIGITKANKKNHQKYQPTQDIEVKNDEQ